MSLIPVDLGKTNPAIGESDGGNSLQLTPPAFSVHPSQREKGTHTASACNHLDVKDLGDDLESHVSRLSPIAPMTMPGYSIS
jgi:hypothetical protein